MSASADDPTLAALSEHAGLSDDDGDPTLASLTSKAITSVPTRKQPAGFIDTSSGGFVDPKVQILRGIPREENKVTNAIADIPGSILHGVGTALDVGRNDWRVLRGETAIPYNSPESFSTQMSAPFAHAPEKEPESTDPKEAIRRGLPKLGDQGPLGQTVVSDVLAPAADVGQAALSIAGARGLKGGPVIAPTVDELAAQSLSKSAARQSAGAAGAVVDMSRASPGTVRAVAEARGNVNHAALQRTLEADSIGVQLTKGQATGDSGLISNEKNYRGDSQPMRERLDAQNTQLVDALDNVRREEAPDAVGHDPVQNGQALVDKYKSIDDPLREDITAKYKKLADANGGSLPLDGASFASAANIALKKNMKAPFLPSAVRSIIDDAAAGGDFTFENFENLRTTLAAEARKAARAGDGNAEGAINITRNALEQLPMSEGAGPLRALADDARSAARARFERLRADPAYRAAVEDSDAGIKAGESSPIADDFVRKYVIGGRKAHLDLMRQTFANDPEALGTISASALNYLKKKSGIDPYTNEGNFSQSGYNKALAELEPRIDALLSQKGAETARTIGNVARYTQAQSKGSFVNNSGTAVTQIAEAGKGLGMTALDAKTMGAASLAGRIFASRARQKLIDESLRPGAGIAKE